MITLDAIIPIRDNVRYTAGILQHILACEVKPRKLWVIDNGSKDNTQAVCEDFATKLPCMEYIRHETNVGVNPAWNYAFEHSDADHIAVLNNDLILNHGFFDKIIKTAEKYPDVGIMQAFDVGHPSRVHEQRPVKISPVTRKMVGYAFTVSRQLRRISGLIPATLVIYCGDQILFDIAIEEKMPVLLMEHNFIYHYISKTCKLHGTQTSFLPKELKEFQRVTKERCAKKGVPLPWNAMPWK